MTFPTVVAPAVVRQRKIFGASAVLLPIDARGEIIWDEFDQHVLRTAQAGLQPAVNMDTGYVHLLDEAIEDRILARTQGLLAGSGMGFIAGAYVKDTVGCDFALEAYCVRFERIQNYGGTPIVFPSFGLNRAKRPDAHPMTGPANHLRDSDDLGDRLDGNDQAVLDCYHRLATQSDGFYGFELGEMFAAFGKIFSLSLFREIMAIPNCLGLKHSSLRRDLEWQRLELRNKLRPEFKLMTGNDLAIDMVIYGSDYLLGLSTMAPDLFAKRDAMWLAGDDQFFQLNDWLQYLGCFAFRDPVPAYRHSAAQFLHLRSLISTSNVYQGSLLRPASDVLILEEIWSALSQYVD